MPGSLVMQHRWWVEKRLVCTPRSGEERHKPRKATDHEMSCGPALMGVGILQQGYLGFCQNKRLGLTQSLLTRNLSG